MKTLTSFKTSFRLKSKYFSDARPHLTYSWVGFYNELFILPLFLNGIFSIFKNSISVRSFQTEQWITQADVGRTCSYSERHLLLILWLIGNHKTKVSSSIIHITFLKDEDHPAHPEIHTPLFLLCIGLSIKREVLQLLHATGVRLASG